MITNYLFDSKCLFKGYQNYQTCREEPYINPNNYIWFDQDSSYKLLIIIPNCSVPDCLDSFPFLLLYLYNKCDQCVLDTLILSGGFTCQISSITPVILFSNVIDLPKCSLLLLLCQRISVYHGALQRI